MITEPAFCSSSAGATPTSSRPHNASLGIRLAAVNDGQSIVRVSCRSIVIDPTAPDVEVAPPRLPSHHSTVSGQPLIGESRREVRERSRRDKLPKLGQPLAHQQFADTDR